MTSRMDTALAMDVRSMEGLRARAARDPNAALRETAQQFESLFMREMLKSMRAAMAPMKSGVLDGPGSDLATDMLDMQLAGSLTGARGGLGEMIARQLAGAMGLQDQAGQDSLASTSWRHAALPVFAGAKAAAPVSASASASAGRAATALPPQVAGPQGDFLRQHWDAAHAAQASSGIPALFILAQTAHESGWGRREITGEDGQSSHNLFGIKATGGWQGRVAEVTTTEVENGVPRRVKAAFRAYDSYHEAFQDYARLLSQSPRYAGVIEQARSARGFAQGLQDAGYATDPDYALKLQRVINTTLRLQRASG